MTYVSLKKIYNQLPDEVPLPSSTYVNGDGKHCMDWELDSGDGVFTVLSSPEKLLVIVDNGGECERMPCDLTSEDPLANLREALSRIGLIDQDAPKFVWDAKRNKIREAARKFSEKTSGDYGTVEDEE